MTCVSFTRLLPFVCIVLVASQVCAQPQFVTKSIPHGNLTRWYLERKPTTYKAGSPLLILLHGGGGSMLNIKNDATNVPKLMAQTDPQGVLIYAPNGVNYKDQTNTNGTEQYWNSAGTDAGIQLTTDDVGFLKALVGQAITEHGIDPKRVYLMGESNGGLLVNRALKLTYPPLYAGVASFIAPNLVYDPYVAPNYSTPYFLLMGTNDKYVPWNGGLVTVKGVVVGQTVSAYGTRDYWIAVNKADKTKVTSERLRNRARWDGCQIVNEFYPQTAGVTTGAAPVQFVTMEGGGHYIPRTAGSDFGNSFPTRFSICREIDGMAYAWAFLSKYTLTI